MEPNVEDEDIYTRVEGVMCVIRRRDGTRVLMGSTEVKYAHVRREGVSSFADVESVLQTGEVPLKFEAVVKSWQILEQDTTRRLPDFDLAEPSRTW